MRVQLELRTDAEVDRYRGGVAGRDPTVLAKEQLLGLFATVSVRNGMH